MKRLAVINLCTVLILPLASCSTKGPALRDATSVKQDFRGLSKQERIERLYGERERASGVSDGQSTGQNEVLAPGRVAVPDGDARRPQAHNTETYDRIYENPFLEATKKPLSTFSIDVDTASYSNVRRFLNDGLLPPKGAVRIEEIVNYFSYDYPPPEGRAPFSVNTELSRAPWNADHQLLLVGIAGRRIEPAAMPPRNLVFLLDVSGSMGDENKLPLVKRALGLLIRQMRASDRLAIVVYAGAEGLALPSTTGLEQARILSALSRLESGGSTNGGAGIQLAYRTARAHFIKGGINRVILCTDGDFNVGVTNQSNLIRMIEAERESGVFLTLLGFGMGNYKDSTLEKLADKGNGNYAYIDTFAEARKVLLHQAASTLFTIAKDVKLQLEFNPKYVKAYRLIGYENRVLGDQDFNDDRKDAGEIGAGHTVTALYEIVPTGARTRIPGTDPLRYQKGKLTEAAAAGELLWLKIRYKEPDGKKSELLSFAVKNRTVDSERTSGNFRFAAAAAAFGMVLRGSEHRGNADLKMVRALAESGRGADQYGYRSEFIRLVELAREAK